MIQQEGRLACLHLNHAGAAANPKATGAKPKAPSVITCPASGQESEPLSEEEIRTIVASYQSVARKAIEAGFDLIEIQAGHGYLVSQFLNGKVNQRNDRYGQNRLLFAREVISSVREGVQTCPALSIMGSGLEISVSQYLPFNCLTNSSIMNP